MGLLDLFSSGNEKKAARAQQAGLRRGRDAAYGFIDEGQKGYNDFADKAYGEFGTYDDLGRGSATMYSDALGLGGSDGSARARDAFQAGPGYQFQVDEALRALERTGAAAGGTDSGGLYAALTERARGMADSEFDGWLDRLSGNVDRGIGVAGARAGIRTGQGINAQNVGTTKGQIGFNTEAGIGNAEAQYQMSKDNAGMNIFDALMGGLKLFAGS